ncbi:MAG: ATP-binding protein [Magnetococcus sp. MYC-9]
MRDEEDDSRNTILEDRVAELERNQKRLDTLHKLSSLGLSDTDLRTQMANALDIILSEFAPLVHAERRGAIFVWDRHHRELRLVAHHQLSPPLVRQCARLQPGQCLCGRVAGTREMLFAHCIDERHSIRFEGMTPHGHFIVPITSGRRLLGVLNMYTEHGQIPSEEDKQQLDAIANFLAVLIKSEQGRALDVLSSTRLWVIEQEIMGDHGQDMLEISSKFARLLAKACPDYAQYVSALEELIINAIEHGVCGITTEEKSLLKGGVIGQPGHDFTKLDGHVWREEVARRLALHHGESVSVAFEQTETEIRITVTDPGDGFDVRAFREKRERLLMHPNGRGIQVAEHVFDALEYNDKGNQVTAIIKKPVAGHPSGHPTP